MRAVRRPSFKKPHPAGLTAGGRRIRTIGPAPAKALFWALPIGDGGTKRRSHLQVQVRDGDACLEWLSIAFPFAVGPRVRILFLRERIHLSREFCGYRRSGQKWPSKPRLMCQPENVAPSRYWEMPAGEHRKRSRFWSRAPFHEPSAYIRISSKNPWPRKWGDFRVWRSAISRSKIRRTVGLWCWKIRLRRRVWSSPRGSSKRHPPRTSRRCGPRRS